jgi:hypothetical protein
VKRRRAEAKKEPKDESIAASIGSAEQHKGSPDLAELSKGLPSGWEVSILHCAFSFARYTEAIFDVVSTISGSFQCSLQYLHIYCIRSK